MQQARQVSGATKRKQEEVKARVWWEIGQRIVAIGEAAKLMFDGCVVRDEQARNCREGQTHSVASR